LAKTHEIIFVDRKRKQKVPEPVEISQLQGVKVINILGITITNSLSVSPHVQSVIASCAPVSYALRVLRAHGLCDNALHTIYRSVVVAKLLYASCAWEGFANATDRKKKLNHSSIRVKEMDTVHPIYLILIICAVCTSMKVDLFNKVLKFFQYMYYTHYYHPPSVIQSDMVYDPEYTTGLYQREAQILWTVTSSSECYI